MGNQSSEPGDSISNADWTQGFKQKNQICAAFICIQVAEEKNRYLLAK